MPNRDLDKKRSQAQKRADTDVPLWQLRAMISKLRARAAVLDQQISELEWTSQLDAKPGRRKPAKCHGLTVLNRDAASIAMLRDRFLPKTRTGAGVLGNGVLGDGAPVIANTRRPS